MTVLVSLGLSDPVFERNLSCLFCVHCLCDSYVGIRQECSRAIDICNDFSCQKPFHKRFLIFDLMFMNRKCTLSGECTGVTYFSSKVKAQWPSLWSLVESTSWCKGFKIKYCQMNDEFSIKINHTLQCPKIFRISPVQPVLCSNFITLQVIRPQRIHYRSYRSLRSRRTCKVFYLASDFQFQGVISF